MASELRNLRGFDENRTILACSKCDSANLHKLRRTTKNRNSRYHCHNCQWRGDTPISRLRKVRISPTSGEDFKFPTYKKLLPLIKSGLSDDVITKIFVLDMTTKRYEEVKYKINIGRQVLSILNSDEICKNLKSQSDKAYYISQKTGILKQRVAVILSALEGFS